jgi:hypothetical protein
MGRGPRVGRTAKPSPKLKPFSGRGAGNQKDGAGDGLLVVDFGLEEGCDFVEAVFGKADFFGAGRAGKVLRPDGRGEANYERDCEGGSLDFHGGILYAEA